MSELLMEQPESTQHKNRRVGLFLALLILLYILAVIAFIIVY
jgi:ABC-type multidrug transport system permease subunit